ncbi:peptidoglycan recognition protein family protein [Oceanobacillus halophilus]|uniref:Autolysin n=1 Tax=Oceanobacillus halophilus TaxID=930130 RepID=A0A495A496_9BACI|nr:GW dipeptide domain-containing protein [Oceanobacillus halophilus]RKQ34311.1 hypothetical protein D8M06_08000 [Oceanobacillus halophilus]
MKNLVLYISIISCLLIFSPVISFGDEISDSNKNDLNEFGIEVGTEVYGEDISELSEEQLQYIPKGWRDGEFESEHLSSDEVKSSIYIRSIYPDVNNYIRNLNVSKVRYEYKDFFTKFTYRNGYGAIEGVVAHETANDNSNITQEISYMSRNHENAFVHAFVDHENIIEIHPLNYGAWGAGRIANQRFVHVELVRVNNFDQFARSINNYADYIADILYTYNLGVNSAERDGKGTLWSHKAVSIHLGKTNHVDPHGYFARYGYNWNEFLELVNDRHNKIVSSRKANTSKVGHLKSSDALIYNNPVNLSNSSKAGSSNTDEVFYIKAEATINGKVYYLLSRKPNTKNGVLGWAKAEDLRIHNHVGIDTESKSFIVNGNGKAFNKVWGGDDNIVYHDLSKYKYKDFKINKTEKVGNNIWYRGVLQGRTVWIHENFVETQKEQKTSKLGHIKNKDVKIYESIGNENSANLAGEKRSNKVYYIKKQAKIGSESFYLISEQPSSKNGVIGWVKAKDLSTHVHKGVDTKSKTLHIKGTGNAYSKAWGGDDDLVYNLSEHAGKELKVNKTESVGKNTWYRGYLDGEQVFIHSSYVAVKTESGTSQLGHINNSDVLIYQNIGDKSSAINAEEYMNAVYYIKKQAKLDNQTYYLLSEQPSSKNGVIGWVKAKDLSTHVHKGVDTKSKTLHIKGTGKAYTKAWGGDEDLVYNLSEHAGKELKVNKTESVGKNTWYRGYLDGEQVFIHSSYVAVKTESGTSKLGHIKHSDVLIYQNIGDKTTAKSANEYLNAVYYIKKQTKLDNQIYYLISKQPSSERGIIGWVREEDLSTHNHKGVDTKSKIFHTKGTGEAYSKAWGGSKDLVYDLSEYAGKKLKVNKTETVGKNTWYRGYLEGKQVFIHSSYLE